MSSSDNSSSTPNFGYPDFDQQYHLNSKIMIIAISILFFVVFFIICLHIYAKWFWRRAFTVTHGHALHNTLHHHHNAAHSGLDKASIDKLPVFVYNAPEKDPAPHGNDDKNRSVHVLECAVCLSEFQENDHGRILPACNHCFHIECIDMWFLSHSTCPLCRKEVMPPASTSDPVSTLPPSSPPEDETSSSTNDPHPEALQDAVHMPNAVEDMPSSSDWNPINMPSSSDGNPIGYPSNVLFWGNQSQVSSQTHHRHPSSSSSSSSLPRLPSVHGHITVDIPNSKTPEEDIATSGNSSDPAPSLKYAGFRNSIKRILSRQSSRVSDINPENPKDAPPV